MGDILPFPERQAEISHVPPKDDTRVGEAALLRNVVGSRGAKLEPGDQERIAKCVDSFIRRHGEKHGRGSLTPLCKQVWKCRDDDENPTRRRREIWFIKKPKTFAKLIYDIAAAIGGSPDDMLLEAFRDTWCERQVEAHRRGKAAAEPELEGFWSLLSGTLHALAEAISRAEGLDTHLERMVALHGTYDLAADTMHPSSGRPLGQPLANWNEHWSEFPPIPSVVLFAEPKSVTVERELEFVNPARTLPVQVTVMREVRLAIGPVDNVLVPGPLFEFRSVLRLVSGGREVRVRCPWLYLETEEDLEVELDGAWQAATLSLAAGNPDAMPEGYEQSVAYWGDSVRGGEGHWRFPASLEAPLQWEHNYIVWRPVTASTCRDVLLRPYGGGMPDYTAPKDTIKIFCPTGTFAEAVEIALHGEGPDSLPERLRAEARRMAEILRGWHAIQKADAEVTHQTLRSRWENWS